MQVTSYNPPPIDKYGMNNAGYNANFRKENQLSKEYTFFVHQPDDRHKLREALTIRIYCPNQVAYCCFWMYGGNNGASIATSGKAGGYGYHKQSAAFEDAARKAGFKFANGIGGVGEDAIIEAGKAILAHFGLECYHVHTAHG